MHKRNWRTRVSVSDLATLCSPVARPVVLGPRVAIRGPCRWDRSTSSGHHGNATTGGGLQASPNDRSFQVSVGAHGRYVGFSIGRSKRYEEPPSCLRIKEDLHEVRGHSRVYSHVAFDILAIRDVAASHVLLSGELCHIRQERNGRRSKLKRYPVTGPQHTGYLGSYGSLGPVYGNGHDLHISSSMNLEYCNFPYSYGCNGAYLAPSSACWTELCGPNATNIPGGAGLQIVEMEVFYKR